MKAFLISIFVSAALCAQAGTVKTYAPPSSGGVKIVNPPPAPMETNAAPLVEIDVGNQNVKEETHVNSDAATTSKTTSSVSDIISQPLWVKILGTAIGLGALAWVFFWFIRSVKAGAAGAGAAGAFKVADAALANATAAAEARLSHNTDPALAAVLQAHVTDLNKARGKIATQAPAPNQTPTAT